MCTHVCVCEESACITSLMKKICQKNFKVFQKILFLSLFLHMCMCMCIFMCICMCIYMCVCFRCGCYVCMCTCCSVFVFIKDVNISLLITLVFLKHRFWSFRI